MRTTTTAQNHGIPAMCCTAGNPDQGFDLNSDWTCRRTHHLYSLNGWAGQVDEDRELASKLGDDPIRQANILRRAAAQETEVARLAAAAYWLDYPCAGVGHINAAGGEV